MKDNRIVLNLDDDEAEALYLALRYDDAPDDSKTGILFAEICRQIAEQMDYDL